MIAHISIGVRDIDRSKRFYEAALEPLGYKCLRAARTLLGYGYGRDSIALWIVQAEHPVPADEKSGLHFCFTAAMPPPWMRFTQRRCALAGVTTVHPACVRIRPRLLRCLHHRSGRIPDRGVLRSSRNLKSAPIKMTHSPWLPSSPTTGGRRRLRSSFDLDGWSRRSDELTARNTASQTT